MYIYIFIHIYVYICIYTCICLWEVRDGPAGRRCVVMGLGTHEPVKARFWPWLEPFSVSKSFTPFELCCSRTAAKGPLTVAMGLF